MLNCQICRLRPVQGECRGPFVHTELTYLLCAMHALNEAGKWKTCHDRLITWYINGER